MLLQVSDYARRVVRNRLRLRDISSGFFSLLRVLCVNLFGQFFCIFTDDGRVVFDGHFVSTSIVSGAAENSLRLQSDGEVSGLLEGECALDSNVVFDLWRRRRGTCVYYLEIC